MDHLDPSFSTAEKLAEQDHVSPATVKRAEKFADAVDKLPPEEKAEVLAGKSEKTKQEIKGFPLTEIRCPYRCPSVHFRCLPRCLTRRFLDIAS
jgi:hypothetical protein